MEKALSETLAQRERTHGDFKGVACAYEILKNIMLRGNNDKYSDEHKLALDMICQKLARIACGNSEFADHWHDIAGYASLAEKHCKEREF